MKTQATYQSNLDYERTYDAPSRHPKLKSIDAAAGAGIIAWFRGSQPFSIRISPEGGVTITYASDGELQDALNILEEHGVPSHGTRVGLIFKGRNPPYDTMRSIYDQYQKGHLWHPSFCSLCMIESLNFSNQLTLIPHFIFGPLEGVRKWYAAFWEIMLPKGEG